MNDRHGIRKFIQSLPDLSWYIMEATRICSLQLAIALYEKGVKVPRNRSQCCSRLSPNGGHIPGSTLASYFDEGDAVTVTPAIDAERVQKRAELK
jgi:hypothetical protein